MAQVKALTAKAVVESIFCESETARVEYEQTFGSAGSRPAAWLYDKLFTVVSRTASVTGSTPQIALKLRDTYYSLADLRAKAAECESPEALIALTVPLFEALGEDIWHLREVARFENFRRDFKDTAWYGEVVNYLDARKLLGAPHYLRLSKDDPNLWVHTPSEAYGRADRQVKAKLGKLLTKLLLGEPAEAIKRVATYFQNAGAMGVEWATTEEEILHVYESGPESCMKGEDVVRAYAHPDIALAYTVEISGRITSRALCNMVDRQYSRVYGNQVALETALQAQGFTRGSLEGCRLKTIFDDPDGERRYLRLPWLDHPDAGLKALTKWTAGNIWKNPAGNLVGSTRFNWDPATETITICHHGGFPASDATGRPFDLRSTNYLRLDTSERHDEDSDDDSDDDNTYECNECSALCGQDDDGTYIEHLEVDVCNACLEHRFTWAIYTSSGRQAYFRNNDVEEVAIMDCGSIAIATDEISMADLDGYVYSEYHNEYLRETDAVWSDDCDSWLFEPHGDVVQTVAGNWNVLDNVIELHDGRYIADHEDMEWVELSERSAFATEKALIGDRPDEAVDVTDYARFPDADPCYMLNSEMPTVTDTNLQLALAA